MALFNAFFFLFLRSYDHVSYGEFLFYREEWASRQLWHISWFRFCMASQFLQTLWLLFLDLRSPNDFLVTFELVGLQTLKAENIEFLVAPYEADAQLAYLSSLTAEKGGIAAVVTEDSDLICYSCPAVRTPLKLLHFDNWGPTAFSRL